MEVPFTSLFEDQRRAYGFCFTCESCAHFDEPHGRCSLGFPNRLHKSEHFETQPRPATILFCKEFDLA